MICEGEKPNYEDIIISAETPRKFSCKHDFWGKANLMDFGDVILCQRCNQYFTKIKHMVRVVRSKAFETLQVNGQTLKVKMKAKANHINVKCMVRVPVRILDFNDKD